MTSFCLPNLHKTINLCETARTTGSCAAISPFVKKVDTVVGGPYTIHIEGDCLLFPLIHPSIPVSHGSGGGWPPCVPL